MFPKTQSEIFEPDYRMRFKYMAHPQKIIENKHCNPVQS